MRGNGLAEMLCPLYEVRCALSVLLDDGLPRIKRQVSALHSGTISYSVTISFIHIQQVPGSLFDES